MHYTTSLVEAIPDSTDASMEKFTQRGRVGAIADFVRGVGRSRGIQLLGLWTLAAAGDRLWLASDRSVPDWDRADYLTGSLNYWEALQFPQWLSADWWTNLWLLSSKIPPLHYIATAPFYQLFGTARNTALLLNLAWSAVLLLSLFELGKRLFSPQVGVWAAGLCLLMPGLVGMRLHFLLDYPLVAVTTLVLLCLTAWRSSPHHRVLWTIALGLSLGAGLLVKQSIALFLLVPFLWTLGALLSDRRWNALLQGAIALGGSAIVWGWWYRANWILVLTSSKRATVDSALAEGDPPLNTLAAWTFYITELPTAVSGLLLAAGLVGLLLWGVRWVQRSLFRVKPAPPVARYAVRWLLVMLVGGYLLSSANVNKDPRYVLPLLPLLSLPLAYGLLAWGRRWRWGVVGLATLGLLWQLRPTTTLGLGSLRPYVGAPFPHEGAIAAVIEAEPYLRHTLGVLPSTPTVNQHNLNYYGARAGFQVYGRQVGVRDADILRDARSLPWFVTKTGDPGSVPDSYGAMVAQVESGELFEPFASWQLPEGNTLQLHRRRTPLVRVLVGAETPPEVPLRLDSLTVPPRVPPGAPVPVAYRWIGGDRPLQGQIVLATWQQVDGTGRWFHDRAIADGRLYFQAPSGASAASLPLCRSEPGGCTFEVWETTAMLPPADLPPGAYRLQLEALNPRTGERSPLPHPPVTIALDPAASPVPAPELDWGTQFRQLAATLPQGTAALEAVFAEIARINQYDPVQDYLAVTIAAANARLESGDRADLAYAAALAWVLEKRADRAIAAFERVTAIDPENPYAYAYLAVVNLADWKPGAAQRAIARGRAIAPDLPELQLLDGVASLFRGRLLHGWRELRQAEAKLSAAAEGSITANHLQ